MRKSRRKRRSACKNVSPNSFHLLPPKVCTLQSLHDNQLSDLIRPPASEKCQQEKRKTVNGEDILFAMTSTGFENYAEALKIYLAKYREVSPSTLCLARLGLTCPSFLPCHLRCRHTYKYIDRCSTVPITTRRGTAGATGQWLRHSNIAAECNQCEHRWAVGSIQLNGLPRTGRGCQQHPQSSRTGSLPAIERLRNRVPTELDQQRRRQRPLLVTVSLHRLVHPGPVGDEPEGDGAPGRSPTMVLFLLSTCSADSDEHGRAIVPSHWRMVGGSSV